MTNGTEDYKSYTFSLGDSPKRNYIGMRAPVSQGKNFAFDALDKWLPIMLSIFQECNLQDGVGSLDDMRLVVEIAKRVKLTELMEQGDKILSSQITQVTACEDNTSNSYALSSQKHFDDWFAKHPSDMMQVYAYAIWNNVKPFISSFMDVFAGAMKETASPSV